MQTIKIASGYEMPVLGLGTWQLQGAKCREAVKTAIKLGYRHIDTAYVYENHEEVGKAIKESKIPRKELFITSKVWAQSLAYDDLLMQCEETLNQLQLDYLDLYLIHWPSKNIPLEESFKAFKKLKEQGKVKSFGVSNFNISKLKEAVKKSQVPISINQVEYHAYLNQEELLKECKHNNVILTAYSPLGRGEILKDPVLISISKELNKIPSQIALRWLIQKNIIVIPKASSESHLKENMDIFNFKLTEKQMELINNIKTEKRFVKPKFLQYIDLEKDVF